MLRSPQTFSAIVRVGPLAEQAQALRELLEDAQRSAYVAVTHASEMAVTETLELEEGLRRELDRDLDAVIVNGTMPSASRARSLSGSRWRPTQRRRAGTPMSQATPYEWREPSTTAPASSWHR